MFTSGNEYDILGAERVEEAMADWHTHNARRARERKPQRPLSSLVCISVRRSGYSVHPEKFVIGVDWSDWRGDGGRQLGLAVAHFFPMCC